MPAAKLHALTSLRFFAALGVILFHIAGLTTVLFTPAAYVWLPLGRTCVSFFFILSGCVLAYTYADTFRSGVSVARFRAYFRNRLVRIWPLHAVILLAMLPGVTWERFHDPVLLQATGSVGLVWQIGWTWLAQVLLVHIHLPLLDAVRQWNIPAWSLACEIVFYASLPWLIARLGRWRQEPWRLTLVALGAYGVSVLLFAVVAVGVGRRWLVVAGDPQFSMEWWTDLPWLRLWEFIIGVTIGLWLSGRRPDATDWLRHAAVRSVLALASIAAGIGVVLVPGSTDVTVFSKATLSWYVLYTPILALLILTVGCGPTVLSPLLENRWLIRLGEASFALYLVHWPVMNLEYWLQHHGWMHGRFDLWGHLLIDLTAALCLHLVIEEPLRRRWRVAIPDRPAAAPADGLAERV